MWNASLTPVNTSMLQMVVIIKIPTATKTKSRELGVELLVPNYQTCYKHPSLFIYLDEDSELSYC